MISTIRAIFDQLDILPNVLVNIIIENLHMKMKIIFTKEQSCRLITFYNNFMYIFDEYTDDLIRKNIFEEKNIIIPSGNHTIFSTMAYHDRKIYVLTGYHIRVYDDKCDLHNKCNFIKKIPVTINSPSKILIRGKYIYVGGYYSMERINIYNTDRTEKMSRYIDDVLRDFNIVDSHVFLFDATRTYKYNLELKYKNTISSKNTFQRTLREIKNKRYMYADNCVYEYIKPYKFVNYIDNGDIIRGMHYNNGYLYLYSKMMISIYSI